MTKQLSDMMEQYVEQGEMACGVLFVHKDGELVFKGKWGFIDEEKKVSVEYNSIFRMASMTKVLTAVGVLKLLENNKLGLDDEVSKYIPGFSNKCVVADDRFEGMENLQKYWILREKAPLDDVKVVPANRELTIRDLLTHSSGLEMGLYGFLYSASLYDKEDTLKTRIDKLCTMALDFHPGTSTGYSPTASFDLLARIIEVVNGEPFDVYMEKEIFSPLEMKDAAFHLVKQEQKKRLVPLYKLENGQQKNVTGTSEDINGIGSIGPKYMSGAAGVYCTAEDYSHFTRMLCDEGLYKDTRILKEKTVKMVYKERAYQHLEPEPGMEWGLGVKVRQNPEKAHSSLSPGAYGWSGAFGTHFFICPKEKLAATFVMNRADIGGSSSYISKKVEEMVFSIWGKSK